MYQNLAVIALFTLIFSVIAGRLERTWISGPIVFTSFGLLAGPVGFDLLPLHTDRETIRTMAELTLAVVLFTDAAGADMGTLKKTKALPIRLLLIGLPLTIALGFGVGLWFLEDLSFFEVALLATLLAPTDAALGKAVVTNPILPGAIREGLNVESGLNDGICVPILFVFLALALGKENAGGPWHLAVMLVAKEIGIGLAVGLLLTLMAGRLLKFSSDRWWMSPTWIQIPVFALALACFAIAQLLGGSGFIAAFAGGLLFGSLAGPVRDRYLRAAEGIGDTLALVTWVIFGAAVVGQSLPHFSWTIALYALMALTVLRMLPVFLVLAGTGLDTEAKLFVGWFGPRGLASIVFAVIVLDAKLPNSGPIAMTAACTIILSILLHGISANPWAAGFGRRNQPGNSQETVK